MLLLRPPWSAVSGRLEVEPSGAVIVTGRSELNGEKRERIEGLGVEGERVSYRQVELCNAEAVKGLVEALPKG